MASRVQSHRGCNASEITEFQQQRRKYIHQIEGQVSQASADLGVIAAALTRFQILTQSFIQTHSSKLRDQTMDGDRATYHFYPKGTERKICLESTTGSWAITYRGDSRQHPNSESCT